MMRKWFVLGSLLFSGIAAAIPEHSPWPGGVGVMRFYVDDKPTVTIKNDTALVIRDAQGWSAIFAIPLEQTAPGTIQAVVNLPGSDPFTVIVDVRANSYREQRLNVDRKYVEPTAEQLERILADRSIIDAALTTVRDVDVTELDMQAPVAGRRSSSFGLRRFFNDQPRSPHKGMDIAAVEGTSIEAPLGGVVTATGDYYFNGNTVIVDHGQGFISLYCHLSKIVAEPGQSIEAGTVLGEVGATGRVTGAHLHFATYLGGNAVDPALFLSND